MSAAPPRIDSPPFFSRLTILGPGLLGASIAMAAKETGIVRRVAAWSRRAETRERCLRQNWCDEAPETAEKAVSEADLIVFCTPVENIVELLGRLAPSFPGQALLTDVGSTKSRICEAAHAHLPQGTVFVGAHPMAGSEKTGMEHARSDLFENASCLVTPREDTPADALARVEGFWKSLGLRVTRVSPAEHDRIVAHISHLPHAAAAALCACLSETTASWAEFAGAGLRDTTRVASGDPDMWQQILHQNREEILPAIDGFQNQLQQLTDALRDEDPTRLRKWLKRGKNYRDNLPPHGI